ncbi:MarR family winged helix-turn-helix transcriptional regulator [Agrobacterium sp. SHOUNA12C]|uniref:MarR family winged helix-turn-helix transcriptional regulator n=1 Tax=Rhizobium rhizogenes TaxID=359 RepID=UPI0005AB38DC|nr:MarR family winged helix-turn-helix transcriptional regulator [Rhizobium rhizogenes]MCJ9720560.1 MarR family winged helix-turn-helix transcriptional regulator [Agrobacterium sp. BETTINA12B]MCJ9758531.1 MarR family winged helix-turn-helix transcriptional regulator [Agrobacterium sp. SHOUNA12C]NTF51448.1 winged helix-turn-helix transcriptional regulator [Rhizobium rhizogenes]NTF57982.1 winged helix-turn-helix transcriptional regulator [Rhizobium rhizogenes]NTF64401.1 winged helix-turn-helix t
MADVKHDRPDTDDYDVTQQVGHLLRRVYQRHLSIFQDNASDPNLTSVQFVTLCALRDHGPSSQTELVKATAVDQGTIRGIIERLSARGLITTSGDEQDGRKIIMSLTLAAEHLLDEMIPAARVISELTMADLNPAERVALLYLLRRILNYHDDRSSGAPEK